MKTYIIITLTALAMLSPRLLKAATPDTLAFTYERFVNQKGMEKYDSYFNIYKQDKSFWMEIPQEAMGRDLLITCQAIKGYTCFLSPASDVVTLEHHDLHTIYLRRHRSLDYQRDTLNASIMDAIRNSNLQPIDRVLNIVCLGKDGKSYIVDITRDVTSASGLFDVTKNNSLSHPDPTRSGWLGTRPIPQGFSMEVFRSQTDALAMKSMNDRQDVASTIVLQFVVQMLPRHNHVMRPDNPAFGFEAISRQEYDSKTYVSRRRNYITSWDFSDGPLTLHIDPDMPEVFKASVRQAVKAWTSVLNAAGIKRPFVFSTDRQADNLAYKCVTFVWGNAMNGANSYKVTDPLTGEILSARINILDYNAETYYEPYYILFRNIDTRVKQDFMSLGMRQNLTVSWLMKEIGKVLGLKENCRGRSIMNPFRMNYAATSDTPLHKLLPTVTLYDRQAIKYVYGGNDKAYPALTDFYSAEDARDPYATKTVLSANVIADSRSGIEKVRHSYASLIADVKLLPVSQLNMQAVSHLAVQHLTLYSEYLQSVTRLVGGRSKYPIIKGISESPVVYVPRDVQKAALRFLEENILSGIPSWIENAEVQRICSGNMYSMTIGVANDVMKALLSADALQSLANQERDMGATNALTAKELLDFADRTMFCNFDSTAMPSDFQRKMQITAMLNIADYVHQHNVVTGMQHEGNCILQVYLVETYKKISSLAANHCDQSVRDHYAMLRMRLDRSYFKKKI